MALSDWLPPRNKVANRTNTVALGKASSGGHSPSGAGLGSCAFCTNNGRYETRNSKGKKIKVCTTHKRMLS